MGGYFVVYVLGALALLAWGVRSSRRGKWAAALVIVLTLICMLLPASHELRYYMFWMLTLVSSVLVTAHSPTFSSPQQAVLRNVTHGVVAISCASVLMMTGGEYLRLSGPSTPTLSDLLEGTDEFVAQVPTVGRFAS